MRVRGHKVRIGLGFLAAVGAAAGLAVAAPIGGGAARTSTVALTPVADSHVMADKPRRNFGNASKLVIARRPASIAYLRFSVAVPAGETVTRATLQLFGSSSSTVGFTVSRVASTTWREAKTTYANAPSLVARPVASSSAPRGKAYISVDVTSLMSRGGLVSFAVRGTSPSPLSIHSRESSFGRPRLVIETSRPAPPPASPPPTLPPPPLPPPPTPAPTPPPGGSGGSSGVGRPCGTVTTPPASVDHVIWIWMENKPYDAIISSSSAPFETELAAACGLAMNYYGVTHPSLPNYIAATSGSTQGIADSDPPSSHPLEVPSIFSQVKARGKTWRAYEESAPGPCPLESSGLYAVRHDPASYYTGIRSDCAVWNVPMGTTAGGSFLTDLTGGTLPAFSFITPDLCHGTHDCSVATGDAWLKSWFAKILASPTYNAGRTVIFLTWDEDDGSASNHIPLIIVSPSTAAGTRSGTFFDHYSLLKTTEQLLGITTFLGHAGDVGTSSIVSAFNLG